jgi:hypothetical protein
VKYANSTDAQTAEALEVALQPLDIAFSFGQGA